MDGALARRLQEQPPCLYTQRTVYVDEVSYSKQIARQHLCHKYFLPRPRVGGFIRVPSAKTEVFLFWMVRSQNVYYCYQPPCLYTQRTVYVEEVSYSKQIARQHLCYKYFQPRSRVWSTVIVCHTAWAYVGGTRSRGLLESWDMDRTYIDC